MKKSQEKSKTMPMQFFSGVEAVHYGIVHVDNSDCHSCYMIDVDIRLLDYIVGKRLHMLFW